MTPRNLVRTKGSESDNDGFSEPCYGEYSRRSLLRLTGASLLMVTSTKEATAYEDRFPIELRSNDAGAEEGSRERRLSQIRLQQEKERKQALEFRPITAAVWGSALWLLSGSRSNPLATPLANALYDAEEEDWLRDRNDGLFAALPLPLLVTFTIIFFALGAVTDLAVSSVIDFSTSLPIAGVSLVTGAFFELGRIASGDKKATREESEKAIELEQEFLDFAAARLLPGGGCHRQEVTRAFRRYHAKYRQADYGDNPLSDLAIERLIRKWSSSQGLPMSSSGFFKGIRINKDADIFVSR